MGIVLPEELPEINKMSYTQNVILEHTFSSAYFLMSSSEANIQFVQLIKGT